MAEYIRHPSMREPEDKDTRIWRYVDFTKFVSMLETNALYFTRSDQFPDDPFEGSVSKATLKARDEMLGSLLANPHNAPEDSRRLVREIPIWNKMNREKTYLNCWHMNEHESAAMWKLYARSNEAVAIESTFRRLRDVLPGELEKPFCCWVGMVRYVDYEKDEVKEGNHLWPFTYKRMSFAHERELRAVCLGEYAMRETTDNPVGHLVPVDRQCAAV